MSFVDPESGEGVEPSLGRETPKKYVVIFLEAEDAGGGRRELVVDRPMLYSLLRTWARREFAPITLCHAMPGDRRPVMTIQDVSKVLLGLG